MPVQSCNKDGKSGYKYGESGKCYTYTDKASRKRANENAQEQGRAIKASQARNK